jgi:hypothetical protein
MGKIATTDGSTFMQILTEFYRQSRYVEKDEKTKSKHVEVSDELSKAEEMVQHRR